ncbi:glutamate carboxypeptidase [Caulobacter sp. S45]|uniref:glutamate carboxypeptidase n=1 Tax=Caulobacter sp. S45 TaxID=1641861 RepID=UPI00131E9ECB|nr:glutamate carboxypeptidase [Caulobacter sp. S45]
MTVLGHRALWLCGTAGAMAMAWGAQAAPRDARVFDAATAARAGQLDLLKSVVDIDSGTGDAEGAARVDAILIPRLQALGASIRKVPAEAPGLGENVVATLEGTGKGRILMIGHIDTVFPAGTVKHWAYHTDNLKAYGPGVSDEKGGVVEGITALTLLHELKFTGYARITLLIETSEETGSPGTRKLIDSLMRQNDVELNLEPGDAPDAITVWRKGSTTYTIAVHGRAAHAGVAPQDGRNAAVELIHQLQAVEKLPHTGDGLTANLTVLKAGERNNIIPDLAEAQVNVRVRSADQLKLVQDALEAQAKTTVVPDTKVEISTTPAFPPLPNNPATDALAARAKAIYAGIARPLETAGNGGASESALAHAAGTPALDGLGPVGGGFHSTREYLELRTVTPRLYLLTELLMQIGAAPPAKP